MIAADLNGAVRLVAMLNLSYFGIEFAVAFARKERDCSQGLSPRLRISTGVMQSLRVQSRPL
jgi:hypothetical protein